MELFYDFIIPGNIILLHAFNINFIIISYTKKKSERKPISCFLVLEVMENEEEECDTDLERQNVEELYDYVRHLHQMEEAEPSFDVQHPGLIPVLRAYQRQAVNWMLMREKNNSSSSQGQCLFKCLSRNVFYFCRFSGNLCFVFYRTKIALSLARSGHSLWQETLLQSLHWMVKLQIKFWDHLLVNSRF